MAPNVFEPEWDADADRYRRARVAKQAGADKLGASLYEVPPGSFTFPLHFHHANEELLVVLSGTPTLNRERKLAPGDVVAFPAGPKGAHRLDNESDEPFRVLIVSTMIGPDINEFPDSGKIWARTWPPGGDPQPGDAELLNRPEANLDYMDGER